MLAERIVVDPAGLTVAVELFAASYLVDRRDGDGLLCSPESESRLAKALANNVFAAAKAGRLLNTCSPGFVLWRLSSLAPKKCSKVFAALKAADSSLDDFALAILGHSFDSTKGQRYSLPDDRSKVESYCPLKALKQHAKKRLADPTLELPAKAAWRAVVEEKSIYGSDGSYARD